MFDDTESIYTERVCSSEKDSDEVDLEANAGGNLNLENELVAAEPSINPPYSKSPRCAAMITDSPDFGRFHSKYITGHVDRVSRSAKPLP